MKRRGQLHGLDNFDVTRAATDVAAERRANVVLARIRIATQQPDGGHDEPRGAIAALGSELFVKTALRRRQGAIAAQTLNGFHMTAHRADRERQTGESRTVVNQYGAGAAFPAVASRFGAGESDDVPQVIQ